ncbi:MAG: hypothetical protein AAF488_14965 [Planctomycetota bacterium]
MITPANCTSRSRPTLHALSPLFVVALLLLGSGLASGQTTWHVDATAVGGDDGLSWSNAFPNLHAAFSVAAPGDTVRVAQGMYTPDVGHPTLPLGERNAFWLYPSDVTVEGGYRGLAAGGSPDDRDTDLFETIFSGEINDPGLVSDNSQTLIRADVPGEILLDGLTLTATYQNDPTGLPQGHYGSVLWTFGSAGVNLHDLRIVGNETINNSLVGQGGALFIFGTDGVISECEFIGNRIGGTQFQTIAGALFLWESDLSIVDCTFEDNVSDAVNGAAYGGAVYIEHGFPVLERCAFRDNTALDAGGAVFHRNAWDPINWPDREGAPTFIDCVFENNLANQGGAAFIWSRRPEDVATFQRCEFLDNKSNQNGAAVFSNGGGQTVMQVAIESCLFTGNETGFPTGGFTQNGCAFDGPGAQTSIVNSTVVGNISGRAFLLSTFPPGEYTIANCIVRDNDGGSLNNFSTSGSIISSNIEGASTLDAAIVQADVVDVDPLFVDPLTRDFRLSTGAPGIDQGDGTAAFGAFDLAGDPRSGDGDGDCTAVVDRGAFEAVDLCVSATSFERGDTNDDGGFDISDAIFGLGALFVLGAPQPTCFDAADANDDGTFDISDAVATLSALFVPGSPSPPAPFGACGADPTTDGLDCGSFGSCP